MKLLMMILTLAAFASAQTQISPGQIAPCVGLPNNGVLGPAVMMTIPTGPSTVVTICVPLDGSLQIIGGRLTAVQQFPSTIEIVGEVPTGLVNGANKVFTLKNTPFAGTLKLFWNGLRQKEIVDCSLSGNTITFVNAPEAGAVLIADYRK